MDQGLCNSTVNEKSESSETRVCRKLSKSKASMHDLPVASSYVYYVFATRTYDSLRIQYRLEVPELLRPFLLRATSRLAAEMAN